MERTIAKLRDNVRTADRKRLDILLRRTRVVVLGKETELRFIGNEALVGVYSVPLMLECRSEVPPSGTHLASLSQLKPPPPPPHVGSGVGAGLPSSS